MPTMEFINDIVNSVENKTYEDLIVWKQNIKYKFVDAVVFILSCCHNNLELVKQLYKNKEVDLYQDMPLYILNLINIATGPCNLAFAIKNEHYDFDVLKLSLAFSYAFGNTDIITYLYKKKTAMSTIYLLEIHEQYLFIGVFAQNSVSVVKLNEHNMFFDVSVSYPFINDGDIEKKAIIAKMLDPQKLIKKNITNTLNLIKSLMKKDREELTNRDYAMVIQLLINHMDIFKSNYMLQDILIWFFDIDYVILRSLIEPMAPLFTLELIKGLYYNNCLEAVKVYRDVITNIKELLTIDHIKNLLWMKKKKFLYVDLQFLYDKLMWEKKFMLAVLEKRWDDVYKFIDHSMFYMLFRNTFKYIKEEEVLHYILVNSSTIPFSYLREIAIEYLNKKMTNMTRVILQHIKNKFSYNTYMSMLSLMTVFTIEFIPELIEELNTIETDEEFNLSDIISINNLVYFEYIFDRHPILGDIDKLKKKIWDNPYYMNRTKIPCWMIQKGFYDESKLETEVIGDNLLLCYKTEKGTFRLKINTCKFVKRGDLIDPLRYDNDNFIRELRRQSGIIQCHPDSFYMFLHVTYHDGDAASIEEADEYCKSFFGVGIMDFINK